jgi:hypothetical protein
MTDLDTLRSDFEEAVAKSQAVMAEKDAAIEDVRARYGEELRSLNDDAARAQKALNDGEATAALRERYDDAVGEGDLAAAAAVKALAVTLGLELLD